MADITNLFKATVKTVKARNKNRNSGVSIPDKSILPTSKKKTEFSIKSKDVVNNISKLRDFLLEHRKDYINASSLIGQDNSKLTDAERDQIDTDAQDFMRTCHDAINTFKAEYTQGKLSQQVKEHRDAVFHLLDIYLKGVCKIYSEQRAIRVKRVVDKKRIARLEPTKRPAKKAHLSQDNEEPMEITDFSGEEKVVRDSSLKERKKVVAEEPITSFGGDALTSEELQMFEEENENLYNEMNSMVDEIRQIEGKVVEISRLQEVFAEKVLEQEKDIDRIADTVVGTTENIKEANEEIREAMRNNAGLRVWILFILIVCTFSLLFLDWYS